MKTSVIVYDRISTPLGKLFLAVSERGIVRTSFNESLADLLLELKECGFSSLKYSSPKNEGKNSNEASKSARLMFERVSRQVDLYFNGKLSALDKLPVHAEGTEFQQDVWSALRKIPAGDTESYGELAEKIGRQRASRAVGTACRDNPLVLIVPCHRVISKDRSLNGFRGGINLKAKLLQHEGANFN